MNSVGRGRNAREGGGLPPLPNSCYSILSKLAVFKKVFIMQSIVVYPYLKYLPCCKWSSQQLRDGKSSCTTAVREGGWEFSVQARKGRRDTPVVLWVGRFPLLVEEKQCYLYIYMEGCRTTRCDQMERQKESACLPNGEAPAMGTGAFWEGGLPPRWPGI